MGDFKDKKHLEAIRKDIEMKCDEALKKEECRYKRINMNLVLLSLIWTGCRKGKKGDFAAAMLSHCSTYGERVVNEVCSGNWEQRGKINKTIWGYIVETLGLEKEYEENGKLLLEKEEDQRVLYSYCYFLSSDERGEVIDPPLCEWLLEQTRLCLLYRRIFFNIEHYINFGAEAEKKGEGLIFQKEHCYIKKSQLEVYGLYAPLVSYEYNLNLIGHYERMGARYEPVTNLEKALYYIRHMEKGTMEDQIQFYQKNIRLVPDERFWGMIDEVAGTKDQVAALEKWEQALEKQLTLIRAKKYIYESQTRDKRH